MRVAWQCFFMRMGASSVVVRAGGELRSQTGKVQMAKNQNTFEKRRREVEKKQRADEKRKRRVERKSAPPESERRDANPPTEDSVENDE